MTPLDTSRPLNPSPFKLHYSPRTLKRAARAIRCCPFRLHFFRTLQTRSVALREITAQAGVRSGYTTHPLTELKAESQLIWLLRVGVLRREVDGQGITDSFRLTPLGHQLLQTWRAAPAKPGISPDGITDGMIAGVTDGIAEIPAVSLGDRLYNALSWAWHWLR